MDNENNILCCGCLSSRRKMINLDVRRNQCILPIISEFTVAEEELSILLCWECSARVDSFTRFVQQVKSSYSLFREYIKQEKPVLNNLKSKSKLKHSQLYNFSIDIQNSDKLDVVEAEVIKTENNTQTYTEPFVTQEYDNTAFDCNSDDEKLIDVSKKLSKVKKKKRKRKEFAFYNEINLSNEDIEDERRIAMLNDDYVNAMFKCERCIVTFTNAEDLTDHISIKHEMYASHYKCVVCECSFISEVSYNYHKRKHTRRYQCVACGERRHTSGAALKHYELDHSHRSSIDIDIQNTQMDNGHKNNEIDLKVNSTSSPVVKYPCELCDKVFRWKTSLRKHAETHRIETGQKRRPYCEPCGLSFTTTSNLQKHVKTSSKHQIQLKLRKLNESTCAESARVEQIRESVNSSRQVYACAHCDRKFQWRGNLLRHINSHLARANGELVCEPCNRTFSSIATYKQHMKISKKHVSENDFKYMCSDCGKRFANKTRLKDHVDWEHLKNYVHTCNVCQKIFKSHTSLYLHKQVVHNKDNAEHLCDHCGKPFPSSTKLRAHIVTSHGVGARAHACVTCGARFTWRACLSRHNRHVHRANNTTT